MGDVARTRRGYRPKADPVSPAQCLRCSAPYDLCAGEVVHRYADCTLYTTPCCGAQVDDRTWLSSPAFRRIGRDEYDALASGRGYIDRYGMVQTWRTA